MTFQSIKVSSTPLDFLAVSTLSWEQALVVPCVIARNVIANVMKQPKVPKQSPEMPRDCHGRLGDLAMTSQEVMCH